MKKSKDQILLVEGNDDLHIVAALCKKYQLDETFDIKDAQGIDNLFEQIKPKR